MNSFDPSDLSLENLPDHNSSFIFGAYINELSNYIRNKYPTRVDESVFVEIIQNLPVGLLLGGRVNFTALHSQPADAYLFAEIYPEIALVEILNFGLALFNNNIQANKSEVLDLLMSDTFTKDDLMEIGFPEEALDEVIDSKWDDLLEDLENRNE